MDITKEQYTLLKAEVEKAIKNAIGESFDEELYNLFTFCVLGEYKENEYTLKSIFTTFINDLNMINWEDWERDVLEGWEDICRFNVGEDASGAKVCESIWYAMQTIPDILKNTLHLV